MSQMPNMGVVQILFYQSVIPANIYAQDSIQQEIVAKNSVYSDVLTLCYPSPLLYAPNYLINSSR